MNTSKKINFKKAAERSIGKFARFSKSSNISSTPTGVHFSPTNEEKESWPGPFATAYEIVNQREEAKRLREELISRQQNGEIVDISVQVDEYETYLKSLQNFSSDELNGNSKLIVNISNNVPSLYDICLSYIVSNVDIIEGYEVLPSDVIMNILKKLANINQLSIERIIKIVCNNTDMLALPDCSNLDEDSMIQLIEQIASINTNEDNYYFNNDNQIKILQLKYCGSSYSDKTAAGTINLMSNVEILHLIGLYKLSDDSLSKLLSSCVNTLKDLNLSYNHHINIKTLTCIQSLQYLTSLNLDFTNLSDEELILLAHENKLQYLTSLSLAGLELLTDDCIISIVICYGNQLNNLNISNCLELTDNTIIHIREHCTQLNHLNLNDLLKLTETSIIGLFITSNESKCLCLLESISFENLHGVTDDVIIKLSQSNKSIRTMNLSGCINITSKSIIALLFNCNHSIASLDISFIRSIKQEALYELVKSSSLINSLSVWGCTQLSKQFFIKLKQFELDNYIKINVYGIPVSYN